MTKEGVSHPYICGRNSSSFLDEAFSLLYEQFVADEESDCSSFVEESQLEHDDAISWNIVEGLDNDESNIFEPVALARGRDDLTPPATCSSPTFRGRFREPHYSSLPKSFTAPGKDFNYK